MTKIAQPKTQYSHNKLQLLTAFCLLLLYGIFAFFTSRADFYFLITLAVFSFGLTYVLLQKGNISFNKLFALSFIFRGVFLCSIPFLSQDFFRFIWDGQLIVNGLNPYKHTVNYFFENSQFLLLENAHILREGMGELNARHFSNYPPLSQFIYGISAFLSRGSILGFIICLRLILMGFDMLFVVFAKKICIRLGKNPKMLFWYILNPLCILEVTGNLHLEGVMISLFVVSIYFLLKYKIVLSSILFSFSVSAKLLSLIFFPFLIKYIYRNYSLKPINSLILFSVVFVLTLGFQYVVFFDFELSSNFLSSVGLWFNNFEFNASIFYLSRWIGYEIVGWNIIKYYGITFPIVFVLLFIFLFFRCKTTKSSLFVISLCVVTVYFLLSTTIHPWYILFPLAISVFTNFKYPIVWSFLVFLSYFAYRQGNFQESLFVISIEYSILAIAIAYDFFNKKLFFSRKKTIP